VSDRRRLTAVVVATASLIAVSLLLAPAPARPPGRTTLTFLDVGEGAATLLQVPGGPTVLVDAGPEPLARELREHGVEGIDLLVLSHGHADHVGGLEDVIGAVPVGTALLPEPEDPSGVLDEIEVRLRAEGTDVRRQDTELRVPGDGWSLQILPSDPVGGTDQNQRENDDALVAVMELAGTSVLLPGDAEGEALDNLGLPACVVVAVPHHGSAGGFDAGLLAELAPRIAVIPVGENRYGHPAPDALEVLAAGGVPFVRTDERGDVSLWVEAGTLRVATQRAG
jgi:competence protein ComEC